MFGWFRKKKKDISWPLPVEWETENFIFPRYRIGRGTEITHLPEGKNLNTKLDGHLKTSKLPPSPMKPKPYVSPRSSSVPTTTTTTVVDNSPSLLETIIVAEILSDSMNSHETKQDVFVPDGGSFGGGGASGSWDSGSSSSSSSSDSSSSSSSDYSSSSSSDSSSSYDSGSSSSSDSSSW